MYPLCHPAQVSGPAEACEEVRLELAKVTHTLVRLGGKALSAYASEVVALLESMLSDAYHDINILGCETLIELNGTWLIDTRTAAHSEHSSLNNSRHTGVI